MRAVTALKAPGHGISRALLSGASLLAAGAGAARAEGGLPQLNTHTYTPQLFWLAVTFLLLFILMKRVALPRISEVIEERKDRVQRDLAAAERLKGETDKALANYEKALADARSSASGIARETRDRLTAEVDAERKAVEDKLARKLTDAEASITATKQKALTSVRDIAAETAELIVSKLSSLPVTKDEIARAIGSEK
jgi:F-type H+-transporting ATPase subunit b